MEGGQSTGGAPTAAPKKGALWIVIAIVVAVAITAAVMDLAVFPALQPAGSTDFKVHLMTFDVGYDRPNYHPEWQEKGSQIHRVPMEHNRAMAHELLLFLGGPGPVLKSAEAALVPRHP